MTTRPDFPLSPLTLDAVQASAIKQKVAVKSYETIGVATLTADLQREAQLLNERIAETAKGDTDTTTKSLLRIAADALLIVEWIEGQ